LITRALQIFEIGSDARHVPRLEREGLDELIGPLLNNCAFATCDEQISPGAARLNIASPKKPADGSPSTMSHSIVAAVLRLR
jgi:hypothetical protein